MIAHHPVVESIEYDYPDAEGYDFVAGPLSESCHASAYFGYRHLVNVSLFIPTIGFPVPPDANDDADADKQQEQ